MSERVDCDYCKGKKVHAVIGTGPYPVVACQRCNLTFLSPRPKAGEINRLYSKEYFSHTKAGVGYTDYECLATDLVKEARRRLTIMQKYQKPGKLLDAGCGFGTFLNEAHLAGYDVLGCDLAREAVDEVRRRYHLNAVVAKIVPGKLPRGPYDTITSWDVIEHMRSPKSTLSAFFKVQKPGGYLFMTTPDIESIDARILGKYWYGYKRIPEHLYYFSQKTLTASLAAAGYITVEVKRWGFQRNLAYCIQQVARYNKSLQKLLEPLVKAFKLDDVSIFFPIIDMLVVARKP